jgi:DNA-binding NarL/FixJ family response regulator
LSQPEDLEAVVLATQADLLVLGVEATEQSAGLLVRLRHVQPLLKVVLVGGPEDRAQIRAAFAKGAAGYLVRTIGLHELVEGLRQIIQASEFTPIGDARNWPTSSLPLTTKELVVLQAAGRGLSNKLIANELWVSEQTVKFHLSNTYRKLGVSNRTQAVRAGHRLKLLPDA